MMPSPTRIALRLAVLTMLLTAAAGPASARLRLRAHRVRGRAGGGSGANCTTTMYNGGALIQHVKIAVVQWGASSTYASQLESFYAGIVQSPYMDWLREYDEPGNSIVRGSVLGTFVDATPPSKTTVDEVADIQPELKKLVAAGTVPAPDADTLYMIHFAPGIVITQAGDPSCSSSSQNAWCAFHGNVTDGSSMLRYAVIPDMSPNSCAQGCNLGSSSDPFVAAAISASHEMIEAVTDPDDSSGWYDNNCDELADMCEDDQTAGSAGGYPVQLIWSKKQSACVDHDSSVMVGDYSLALARATVNGYDGMAATVTVSATPVSGTPLANLGLTVAGLPAGVGAALAPASISTSGSSTLTLTVGASVAPGSYPFTVTGASTPDNVVHAVNGTLQVASSPPDMAVSPDLAPPPKPVSPPDLAAAVDQASPGSASGSTGSGGGQCAGAVCTGGGADNPGGPKSVASGCSLAGAGAGGAPLPLLLLVIGVLRRRRRAQAENAPSARS